MPAIELTDLMSKRVRTVRVAINDTESFGVQWSPDRLTKQVLGDLQTWAVERGSETAEAEDIVAKVIVPLMCGWDITVEGTPYPITAENIIGFGLPLCMAISNAIQADMADALNTSAAKKASAAPSLALVTQVQDSLTGM